MVDNSSLVTVALSFNSDDNDDGLVDDVIDVVVGGGGGGSNNVDGFLVFVVDAALPRGEMTSRRLLLMEGKVNADVIIVVLATTTTKTKSIDDIISWMIVELFDTRSRHETTQSHIKHYNGKAGPDTPGS
jgi:hypothetical protein